VRSSGGRPRSGPAAGRSESLLKPEAGRSPEEPTDRISDWCGTAGRHGETFPILPAAEPHLSLPFAPSFMSRYRGPRLRVTRALGDLPGPTRKSAKRAYPPGQHGQARRKRSEYAIRLEEKQKLRFNYGISERQARALREESARPRTAPQEPTCSNCLESPRQHLLPPRFRAHGSRCSPTGQPWST